jgi:hypothetical protein
MVILSLKYFRKMKNIIILLFALIALNSNVFSQSFTFVRIDPNPVYGPATEQLKSHGVIHNLTSQQIPISISITNRYVTPGWDSIGMCSWVLCYGAGQYNAEDTLRANRYDTLYVYFSPNSIAGNGYCTVTMSYQSTSISQDFGVVGWPLSIKQISTTIKDFALSQNYPNPFNPTTKINFRCLLLIMLT